MGNILYFPSGVRTMSFHSEREMLTAFHSPPLPVNHTQPLVTHTSATKRQQGLLPLLDKPRVCCLVVSSIETCHTGGPSSICPTNRKGLRLVALAKFP